jgi:hypothetical protein
MRSMHLLEMIRQLLALRRRQHRAYIRKQLHDPS